MLGKFMSLELFELNDYYNKDCKIKALVIITIKHT